MNPPALMPRLVFTVPTEPLYVQPMMVNVPAEPIALARDDDELVLVMSLQKSAWDIGALTPGMVTDDKHRPR